MTKMEAVSQEQLSDRIGNDIYCGELAPGMWLKQIDLEERYGCTRLNLRHALESLASRKIVERVPNRGFYVPRIDEGFVRQVMASRVIVECGVVDDLIKNTTPEGLARLSFLASEFATAVREGTSEDQDKTNLAFHREMLTACDNEVIKQIIWDLRRRIPMVFQRVTNTPSRMEGTAREHFEMLEALRSKDPDRLREVISRHVNYLR